MSVLHEHRDMLDEARSQLTAHSRLRHQEAQTDHTGSLIQPVTGMNIASACAWGMACDSSLTDLCVISAHRGKTEEEATEEAW